MQGRTTRFFYFALILVAIGSPLRAAAQTRLLRFPDIHAGQVVFC
jgi:hypothetical protein